MKTTLRLEEALEFGLAIYLSQQLPYAGWLYAVLFLTPDISMLGYLINTRIGAMAYNLFHHKGIALVLYLLGALINSHSIMFAGLVLFGHSAFDRMAGYGLKYSDNFKHTHLGWIGSLNK
jgi:hypothetical protein